MIFRKAVSLMILFLASIVLPAQKIIKEVNAHEIAKGNSTIAITNVRIIDGNGGQPVENGSVVVINGKIADVGPKDKVKIPQGASEVDGTGMSLLPGFIDAHFHIDGEDELPGIFLQNGVTSIRDPGAWMETYENARKSNKPQPRMFLAGPHIDMFPPAYPSDAYVVRDAAEAVTQVNRAADMGASMIKVYFI
jgi:hypothetical protein